MSKDKLIIIGAGGHGRVVADIALNLRYWKEISFLDDAIDSLYFGDVNVIGKVNDWRNYIHDSDIIVGIGNNDLRAKLLNILLHENVSIPTLIHPSSTIGSNVYIGVGTVVMAGVVVNCSSTIGKGVILNTGSTIDHDNCIKDFAHVAPGAHLAGNVKIGEKTWLGVGCSVCNNIEITSQCMIGAGAVVVKSISEKGTYLGIPARRLHK